MDVLEVKLGVLLLEGSTPIHFRGIVVEIMGCYHEISEEVNPSTHP
jgi:hypothetical protein